MTNETYLQHHGILGQKWGVRRYQNRDGSLTSAGKKRYFMPSQEEQDRIENKLIRDPRSITQIKKNTSSKMNARQQQKYEQQVTRLKRRNSKDAYQTELNDAKRNLNKLKNTDYKKYAKDNRMDDGSYTDADIRSAHESDIKQYESQIKYAQKFLSRTEILNKRLDEIDTSSMSYGKAKKAAKKVYNDWLKETIYA